MRTLSLRRGFSPFRSSPCSPRSCLQHPVSFVGQAPGSSDTQVPRSSDLGTKATMSRLSKQPIAAYGVTERVIAYGQGPPVMVYATARDHTGGHGVRPSFKLT